MCREHNKIIDLEVEGVPYMYQEKERVPYPIICFGLWLLWGDIDSDLRAIK